MRPRPAWICALLVAATSLMADTAPADELYKGLGLRTRDDSWSLRANGTVGFHGVEDPWDQFRVSSYPVGGYTNFGLEYAVTTQHSLEVQGGYYWVNDTRNVVALGSPPEIPRPGDYSYEVDAWSAGLTYRFWMPRGGTALWIAFGGAWVLGADLEYREQIEDEEPYAASASGTGPQASFALGYEGVTTRRLRIGMELGIRYSWVDYDHGIYGAGNFNGIYLGLRVGVTRAR
jgi:hypothetical protein